MRILRRFSQVPRRRDNLAADRVHPPWLGESDGRFVWSGVRKVAVRPESGAGGHHSAAGRGRNSVTSVGLPMTAA